jgi:hypothetical protein
MLLDDQAAFTPPGSPVAVPIPVALLVACVMGLITLFTQTDRFPDGEPAEIMERYKVSVPQPLLKV